MDAPPPPPLELSPPRLPIGARIQAWRERHERLELFGFFFGGFLWDVFTLGRIDDWLNLIQEGVYLTVLTLLLALEQRGALTGWAPTRRPFVTLWKFREEVIHFLFGSLLSAYALFYFKSASGLTPLLFLLVLFGLLIANELPRFRRLGPVIRFALLSLCVTTYVAYLLPVLYGRMAAWLFVAAVIFAALPLFWLYRTVAGWSGRRDALVRVAAPGVAMQVLLVVLYFAGAIPPVPLAVEYLGIYHGIERTPQGGYLLLHQRPRWMVWQRGERTFFARPGDRIYCFARVFAPRGFRDRVKLRFFRREARHGWVPQDAIPLTIVGGRDEGFRGYGYKERYTPGEWRVEVQTEDGRALGETSFTVVPDTGTEQRAFRIDVS